MTGLLVNLMPPSVAVTEVFGDPDDRAALYPAEREIVTRAVDKRQREFATARRCARTSLERLGIAPAPILTGPRGAPQWPAGVVGTITHCAGYRAAALGLRRDVLSLGADVEPHAPLPADVLEAIALPAERTAVAEAAVDHPSVCWDRLLFCAKEAVYKTWFPLTGRFLDFDGAHIDLHPVGGTFTATLLVAGQAPDGRPLTVFDGRWCQEGEFVAAAITLPTGDPETLS